MIVTALAALLIRNPLAARGRLRGDLRIAPAALDPGIGRDTNSARSGISWPSGRSAARDHMSPVSLLEPVSRRFQWEYFWSHNLIVVGFEVLLFGAMAVAAYLWRGRTREAAAIENRQVHTRCTGHAATRLRPPGPRGTQYPRKVPRETCQDNERRERGTIARRARRADAGARRSRLRHPEPPTDTGNSKASSPMGMNRR